MVARMRLLFIAALLAPSAAAGAPGELDPTFGDVGIATDRFRSDFRTVLVGPDGKLYTFSSDEAHRLLADGGLDEGFGLKGKVRFPKDVLVTARAVDVAGRLLVGGFREDPNGDRRMVLFRYDADGHLDESFGAAGEVETFVLGQPRVITPHPDGTILVAEAGSGVIRFARFLSDGALDPSWGTAGVTTLDPAISNAHEVLYQPSGKVVVIFGDRSGSGDELAIRFDVDGTRDLSFGIDGVARSPYDRLRSTFVLADGKLLSVSVEHEEFSSAPDTLRLQRYTVDGTLDAAYGTGGLAGGIALLDTIDAILEDDEDVVVHLFRFSPGNMFSRWSLVRFRPDGSLDSTFGTNGAVDVSSFIELDSQEEVSQLRRTPDGRMLLGVTPYGALGPVLQPRDFERRTRHFVRLLGDCGDGVQQVHEACDDGNVEPGDCCSPVCALDPAGASCDVDGDLCSSDTCDGAGACTAGPVAPLSSCDASLFPGGSLVDLRDGTAGDDRLNWKLARGAATARADFGDPRLTTDYALCVYDDSTSALLLSANVPPGGTCGTGPCWTGVGTLPAGSDGYKYRDRERTADGIEQIQLRPGRDGRTTLMVKGAGDALRAPSELGAPLPVAPPVDVRVQLRNDLGRCWEGRFTTSTSNTGSRFAASSD